MTIKQISVFIENQDGSLAAVTSALGNAEIDILALSLADSSDYGVLRLIVSDPPKAAIVLHQIGYSVTTTDVIAIAIGHHPGGLSEALSCLGSDVGVEYCYAFIGTGNKNAIAILRPDNIPRTVMLLEQNGFPILEQHQLFC